MAYPYIMTDTFISITIDSKAYTIDQTHRNFTEVYNAIRNQDWENIESLLNIKTWFDKQMNQQQNNLLYIDFDYEVVTYGGKTIHNTLTSRIFKMWKDGFDVKPMVEFLANLLQNPSSTAVNELYDFLESGNMPITEDGCFLAYKKVGLDYKDIYSGTFDNSVGSICEMSRDQVDDNRNNTCSKGLHFCSQSYLENYGGNPNYTRVVLVKINPADVVSIPRDYNNTKGRCWKYEVYGEVDSVTAHKQDVFEKSVYPTKQSGDRRDIKQIENKLNNLTNGELVKLFNDLTSSHLVKFRDKATGIKRILRWAELENESSSRVETLKQYLDL
jgi:hypothetical protein